jgi:Uma2 family endonuclease
VADSSLEYDQGIKMHLYAETGIPEYWIANLRDDTLIAYSHPEKQGYASMRLHQRGEALTPARLPDCRIPVDVLLP